MKNKLYSASQLSLNKGLTLIEILVTITITSIGLMGLVSLQLQAIRATTDSGNRGQAVWVFNDIIARIHANEAASSNYVTLPSFNVAVGQSTPPICNNVAAPVCSNYRSGIGAPVLSTNCSGADQARWDLYEVACGTPRDPNFQGSAISYLPQAQITITCADDPCLDGTSPLNITLQWRAKADDESVTGAARNAASGLLTISDVIRP